MIKNDDPALMPAGIPKGCVWNYDALESLDEFRGIAEQATLIFGIELQAGEPKQWIAFGQEVLRAISEGCIPPQGMQIAVFVLRETPIEHLLAAVEVVKGFHEVPCEED